MSCRFRQIIFGKKDYHRRTKDKRSASPCNRHKQQYNRESATYRITSWSKLRRSRMGATVFLVNGFQIRGEIRGFDSFVVVIYSDGKQQMVYKHAISTVVPERPLSWEEEDPD